MKLNNNSNAKVETNLTNSNQFKIAMNSKTFKMLSDTLYSDKIKAVIRELACNAYDAQRAAGTLNTHKFYIHLPTVLEQVFRIRDYGTGMLEETIMSLYLTYGESTKDQSNDDIGCFGIGSKSPFAYTDLFTVTSFVNGIKKSYSVYLEDGIPNCVKVFEEETSEENGLEVQFNVSEKDIQKFETASKNIFKFFDILPEFNIPLEIKRDVYDIDTEDYSITLSSYYYAAKNMFALQGNIAYPIQSDMVEKLPFKFEKMLLKFNIGDFSFAPSREAISYDKITIENINKKLKLIENKIITEVKTKLNLEETLYDYILELKKYIRQLELNSNTIKKYKLNIYKDYEIDLDKFSNLDFTSIYYDFKVISPSLSSNANTKLTLKKPKNRSYSFKSIVLERKHKLLINDLNGKSGSALLIEHCQLKNLDEKYFVLLDENIDKTPLENVFGSIESLSNFISFDEEAYKAKKKLNTTQKGEVSKDTLFTYKEGYFKSLDKLDDNKEYLYIPLIRKTTSYSAIFRILNTEFNTNSYRPGDLKYLDFKDKEIVFIKKSGLTKKFLDNNNISSIDEFLLSNHIDLFNNFIKYHEYSSVYSDIESNHLTSLLKKQRDIVSLDRSFKPFTKVIKYYNRFYEKNRTNQMYYFTSSNLLREINEILNKQRNVNQNLFVDLSVESDILEKYPMFKYLNHKNSNDTEFIDYIKLVLGV